MLSKTEQEIIDGLKKDGHFCRSGKRMFNAAKKLEASGIIAGAKWSYEVYNINGPEFRSQWNSPRSKTGYEFSVSTK